MRRDRRDKRDIPGSDVIWFRNLSGMEKLKLSMSLVMTDVFLVMLLMEGSDWWWYAIAMVVGLGAVVMALDLPWEKLEE